MARSIGIEIVNPGHEFGYRSFPGAQIEAVIELSREIIARHSIPPERVLGHSDVAPARKIDPGELFPWGGLALAGVGLWPQTRKAQAQGLVRGRACAPSVMVYVPTWMCRTETVIEAFQRHFRPSKIDGIADEECEAHPGGAARGD